jgi:hypothetical protein
MVIDATNIKTVRRVKSRYGILESEMTHNERIEWKDTYGM